MSGSAGDHALYRQLAANDYAVDVDVQNAPGDRVRLVDDPTDRHDAGVADQYVDRAELALDSFTRTSSMSPIATLAPKLCSAVAVASPIPRAPPVITITLSRTFRPMDAVSAMSVLSAP
jgi:hypothetical protein